MRSHSVLAKVFVLGVFVVVFAAAWRWRGNEAAPAARASVQAVADRASPEAQEAPTSTDQRARALVGEQEPTAQTTPNAAESAVDPDQALRPLVVRIVDQRRQPLAGVEVLVESCDTTGAVELDLRIDQAPREVARGRSDETGVVALDVPQGSRLTVRAPAKRSGHHGQRSVEGCYAGQEIEVELATGAAIHGRITHASDARPVAGARVRVQLAERARADGWIEGELSDARGEYRIEGLGAGRWILDIVAVELGCAPWVMLEPQAGEELRHDVELGEGTLVTGRVIDVETRAGVAGARVGEVWYLRRSVIAGASGEFVLRGFEPSHGPHLYVDAPGYPRTQHPLSAADLASASGGIEIPLKRGISLRGALVDVHGQPLADGRVSCLGDQLSLEGQLDIQTCTTSSSGRFELAGVHSEIEHALVIRKPGYAQFTTPLPASATDLDLGQIVLAAQATVAGRVLDADGSAISGTEVKLIARDQGNPFLAEEQAPLARTDALGCFAFAQLATGRFAAVAQRGLARTEVELELAAGEKLEGIELRFDSSDGVIAGRVVDADGKPHSSVALHLSGTNPPREAQQARPDKRGNFKFDSLAPGIYKLDAYPLPPLFGRAKPLARLSVGDLRPSIADLLVALPRAQPTSGVAMSSADEPLAGALATAFDEFGAVVDVVECDERGAFELFLPENSTVNLRLTAPGSPTSSGVVPVTVGGTSENTYALRGVKAGTTGLVLRP